MLRRSLPLILSTAAFAVSSYAVNVFLARHLGPSKYGTIGLLTTLMTALNVVQATGIPQAMSKLIAGDAPHADDILAAGGRLQIWTSLALMTLFIALSPALAALFHDHRLVVYIAVISCTLPGYGRFTAYAGYFNGLHQFARQAWIMASYAIAKVVLVVVLGLEFGLFGAVLGYALSPQPAVVVSFHRGRAQGTFERSILNQLARPLVIFAVLTLLQYNVDLFTIKVVAHSKATAGFYVAAQNVSIIPLLGLGAMAQVVLPSVSRLVSGGEYKRAAGPVSGALRQLLMVLLPATALIVGSAPGVLRLLFGAAYLPATNTLRVMATSYMAVTVFALLASVLNGAGRVWTACYLAAAGVAVTLVLCIALVPHFGMVSAAASVGGGALVATVGAAVAVLRLVPARVGPLTFLRTIGASGAVLALAWVRVPVAALPLWWLALALVYGLLLLVTGEITRDERKAVWRLLPRRG